MEGWRFTLQGPDYLAVMTYLDNAAIRQQLYRGLRGPRDRAERDNRPLIAPHPRTAPRKGAPAGLPRFRRPRAGRPHGAHRRARAARSSKI